MAARSSFSPAAATGTQRRFLVAGVLFLALALRLAQVSSAMVSPLTYEPGPDEGYYQRFGQAVAAWHGQSTPEFTFMDPGYGFLLGGIFRLVGVNLFVVFLLQAIADAATAYGVLLAGRLLGRPRAGLYGALLYALTSTAIMFTTSLLKEVWVVAFATWWVVAALALLQSPRRWGWLAFGVLCGVGIALRSTMQLLALLALLLPLFYRTSSGIADATGAWRRVMLVALGLGIALLPWSWRNYEASGGISPLPTNGGIVLHQVYNDQNPDANLGFPNFVHFPDPSEVWRGYAAEAQRRLGVPLNPSQVDRYWRGQAFDFIDEHPAALAADLWRKNLLWFGSHEIGVSGSDADQKRFSPVLRILPASGIWLLAAGLAGLLWLMWTDRRWMIVAAPVAVAWLTVLILLPESRFRFHAASMLALGGGIGVEQTMLHWRESTYRLRVGLGIAVAVLIAVLALVIGRQYPDSLPRWGRVAWGYIRMGRVADAQAVAERAARDNPADGEPLEILGYIMAAREDYGAAATNLERAIKLRPYSPLAHYNLAQVYLATGERAKAAAEARTALELEPSPRNQALLQQINSP